MMSAFVDVEMTHSAGFM